VSTEGSFSGGKAGGTWNWAFMRITCWIFLRMRNISDRIVGKIIAHILCQITFLRKSWV
jgi:hypothetical protein